MGHPEPTGDSDTRGILRDLPAGDYDIEFLGYEATSGDYFEVYAAKGAFERDDATSTWQLIGAAGSAAQLAIPGVTEAGWSVRSSEVGVLEIDNLATAREQARAGGGHDVTRGDQFHRSRGGRGGQHRWCRTVPE